MWPKLKLRGGASWFFFVARGRCLRVASSRSKGSVSSCCFFVSSDFIGSKPISIVVKFNAVFVSVQSSMAWILLLVLLVLSFFRGSSSSVFIRWKPINSLSPWHASVQPKLPFSSMVLLAVGLKRRVIIAGWIIASSLPNSAVDSRL